jgi:hypothetical protein
MPIASYDVGAMRVRRRSFDGFEGFMVALGVLFMALSVVSIVVVIALVIALPSADVDFPTGTGLPTNPSTIRIAKIFGIVLFGLLALVAYSVSDLLLEHPWQRLRRWLRKR